MPAEKLIFYRTPLVATSEYTFEAYTVQFLKVELQKFAFNHCFQENTFQAVSEARHC